MFKEATTMNNCFPSTEESKKVFKGREGYFNSTDKGCKGTKTKSSLPKPTTTTITTQSQQQHQHKQLKLQEPTTTTTTKYFVRSDKAPFDPVQNEILLILLKS